ncbi:unnamed protein product [Didymodactylos carnosus]|uniref:Uncharacterized protein n=1 Tax=Didymodactylos carnosus TaxID=1234261 RepID=A0A8S2TJ94_9BILA|nr:unnamed protein product [Didymodactylos carnosus]CAF4290115.1 unnamed protein product [Didymodactylos carnosus]CAF4465415.1 unnamed protein product [Didymodactylos carnosus]
MMLLLCRLGIQGWESSLCQALTGKLSFRHGNLNGTTLRPRAGFIDIPKDQYLPPDKQLRYVIIDVPGLNQAVVDRTRNLYFVRMKEDMGEFEILLEVDHIAQLIVDLTKMMTICLLVIDDKIKEAFRDLYKKVIDIIIRGIKELEDNANKTEEELKSIAEQRLIIVVNKFDRLHEFVNVHVEKENIKRNIRQVLVNDNIPIVFTVGASYAASKNAGNFNQKNMTELKSPEYLKTVDELKTEIDTKIRYLRKDLFKQLEDQQKMRIIQLEASKRSNERLKFKLEGGQRIVATLAVVPDTVRTIYNRVKNVRGYFGSVKNKFFLHAHPLTIFISRNKKMRFLCAICGSKHGDGRIPLVWYYCAEQECKSADKWLYYVHQDCAQIYADVCPKSEEESEQVLDEQQAANNS